MFELLTRARKKSYSPRKARLGLETLEDRAVPAGLPDPSDPPPPPPPAASLTLSITYESGRWVTLSGTYSNAPNVANVAIQVTGEAQTLAWTNFQGDYSVTVEADQLGDMTVQAADLSTAAVSEALTDEAPVLTSFNVVEDTLAHVFSGTVTYHRPIAPDTMYVHFGGDVETMVGKTTEVTSMGTFEEAWELNGQQSDNGTCWAEVVSPWGLVSNRLEVDVLQTPDN